MEKKKGSLTVGPYRNGENLYGSGYYIVTVTVPAISLQDETVYYIKVIFFHQVELAEKINLTLERGKVAVVRGFTPLENT